MSRNGRISRGQSYEFGIYKYNPTALGVYKHSASVEVG
jgi:hypothetical protein